MQKWIRRVEYSRVVFGLDVAVTAVRRERVGCIAAEGLVRGRGRGLGVVFGVD